MRQESSFLSGVGEGMTGNAGSSTIVRLGRTIFTQVSAFRARRSLRLLIEHREDLAELCSMVTGVTLNEVDLLASRMLKTAVRSQLISPADQPKLARKLKERGQLRRQELIHMGCSTKLAKAMLHDALFDETLAFLTRRADQKWFHGSFFGHLSDFRILLDNPEMRPRLEMRARVVVDTKLMNPRMRVPDTHSVLDILRPQLMTRFCMRFEVADDMLRRAFRRSCKEIQHTVQGEESLSRKSSEAALIDWTLCYFRHAILTSLEDWELD